MICYLTTKLSGLSSLSRWATEEVKPGAITSAPWMILLIAPESTLASGRMLGSKALVFN